jgi:hypothetical protein
MAPVRRIVSTPFVSRQGDVIFPLALGEPDHRDSAGLGEAVDRRDEPLTDRVCQHRGGKRRAAVTAEEVRDPAGILQPRHVDVGIDPVDAFTLQRHMLGVDIASSGRGHGPPGPPTAPSG